MKNLIIENVSLYEIMNGINTGLHSYNELKNIRIESADFPSFIIIVTDSTITNSVMDFVNSDKDSKIFNNSDIIIDTEIIDYIAVKKTIIDGKYNIECMSVMELIVAGITLELPDNVKIFDPNVLTFKCYEIDYIEQETELPTDMNILG